MSDENPAAESQEQTADKETESKAPEKAEDANESQEQDAKKELSEADLQAELKKARDEAARRRVELREATKKLREVESSKLSEADRIERLEKALADSERKTALSAIATKHGVPENLIVGSDAEEMAENAQALRSYIDELVAKGVAEKLKENPPMPVVSGEATGGTQNTENDWLRQAFLTK